MCHVLTELFALSYCLQVVVEGTGACYVYGFS